MARGEVSAARMTISEVPRLRVLVAVRRKYVSNLFNLGIETRRVSSAVRDMKLICLQGRVWP